MLPMNYILNCEHLGICYFEEYVEATVTAHKMAPLVAYAIALVRGI